MKNALYLTLVCLFSFCALTPTFADTLTSADAHYLKRAYSQAYKGYSEATKAGQIPESRQKEVEYRSTVCLMHIKPGQTALKATLALVKKYPKTVWEARYLTLLGRIYWILPHTGVKRGDKLFRDLSEEGKRSNDRTVWDANEEASRIDTGHAYDALEAARTRYCSLPSRTGLAEEEILLNVDFLYLVNSSMWQYERDGDPAVDNAPINTEAVYNPKWSHPHKMLYLYEQIKRLAGDAPALRKYRVNAYYDEAVWLDAYHEALPFYPRSSQEAKKPYPYESWKSVPLLEECLRTTPPCPEHNLLRLQLGKLLMEARKPEDAARQTQTVLQAKPNTEITNIAKALLNAIYAPEIEWFKPTSKNARYEYNREVMLTNTKNSVWVRSRNVPSLQCALYRIPMEKWVDKSENSQNWNWKNPWFVQNMFQENGQREERPEQALVREGATLLKRWSLPVKPHSMQAPAETEITVPTQEGGYYVLVASNGTNRTAHVLHITGRVLIASSNGNSYYAYVTDAKSGKPLANQPVFVSGFLKNADGVFVKKLQKLFTNREGLCRWTGDTNSFRTCWTVSGRDIAYSSFGEYEREAEANIQLFGVTDRKIYRPGQTVYYRLVVTKPQGRTCRPITGRAVEVVVKNPKNKEIAHTAAVTNEFGSVHGEIPLPNRAALGGYTITLKEGVSRHWQNVGFKVEEYKKPEFEVKVTTEPERVALGKKGTFKVNVSYYAGGGVPNAKIAYQMALQSPYDDSSRGMFNWKAGRYSSRANASQNGILEQGVLYTNAQGEAALPFDTAVLLKNHGAQEWRWGSSITLRVQAQDSSRRVIEGSGTVNVDRSEGSAFIDLSQRYGRIGSPLEITIHATANDESPLVVTGQAVIQRVQERRRTTVYQQTVSIGKEGTTTLRWTPARGGNYEIQFKAERGRRVESSPNTLLVVGAGLEESDLDSGISLVAERSEYDTEHSARLLLTTPTKECWALFFKRLRAVGRQHECYTYKGVFRSWRYPSTPTRRASR